MHTYVLSDDKVVTIRVDVVIILDKLGHGDVPFLSQTIARRARDVHGDPAIGSELSRAQMATFKKRVFACWHNESRTQLAPKGTSYLE
jgi:hypothetical protein